MKNYATGIQHIGIPTKDMEATKAFFAKLGFEPAFETVNEGAKVAFLKLENLVIETYESDEATMKAGANDHVAIDVKDIEKVYELINHAGLNTTRDTIHFLPFWKTESDFSQLRDRIRKR